MMNQLILPENYDAIIDLMESQRAIKKIKDYFQQELAYGLNLRRVSAPLFVDPNTGLNDNLNGVERRVTFTLKGIDELEVEVVQSLAKWKRYALKKYGNMRISAKAKKIAWSVSLCIYAVLIANYGFSISSSDIILVGSRLSDGTLWEVRTAL